MSTALLGAGSAVATSHTEGVEPRTFDAALVVEPSLRPMEVGEQTFFRVFRCRLASDGVAVRLGDDHRAGTKDDDCRLARDVRSSLTDVSVATIRPTKNRRIKVEALAAGATMLQAETAAARPSAALISVLAPLPAGDSKAIGMRPRGSGDVDGDGLLSDADVTLLAGLLDGSESGYLERGHPTFVPEGDLLGDGLISSLDLRSLRQDVVRAERRDRVQRRGEVGVTPGDIVSLIAGETAVMGAMVGDQRKEALEGSMPVRLLGKNQLYFQGRSEWGATGSLPTTQLWDGHGVQVFTAAEAGSGLVAFVPPVGRPPQVASFEAIPAGQSAGLPGPDGRLTTPYDTDLDGDLDLTDYALAAAALGMRAGDASFPAPADADADGIISFDDLVPIAHVVVLAGLDPTDGERGSGDLDGNGTLDHADLRAAVALDQIEIAFDAPVFEQIPDELSERIERSMAAFTHPARLDMDGDGTFGSADIDLMAGALGADRESLGPNYRHEGATR